MYVLLEMLKRNMSTVKVSSSFIFLQYCTYLQTFYERCKVSESRLRFCSLHRYVADSNCKNIVFEEYYMYALYKVFIGQYLSIVALCVFFFPTYIFFLIIKLNSSCQSSLTNSRVCIIKLNICIIDNYTFNLFFKLIFFKNTFVYSTAKIEKKR